MSVDEFSPAAALRALGLAVVLAGCAAALGAPAASATHGPASGHLPPVRDDVELVSKLELTGVDDGIADVSAFGGHAYVAAAAAECRETGGPDRTGGGVHVIDVSNPSAPEKVAFAPAAPNTHVGDGVHVFHMETASFSGDVLLMNQQGCDTTKPYAGGFSAYDVTDPANPTPLALGAGEPKTLTDPGVFDKALSHGARSVRGWWTGTNAYAVVADTQDLDDIDIFDITDPSAPKLISERGFESFEQIQSPLARGETVFHQSSRVEQIGARRLLQVSYADAGHVTLDVTDPADPVYVADSDFTTPDPLTGLTLPEGNARQSTWSHDNRFILTTEEDFSPYRPDFHVVSGPHQGPRGADEFGWTVSIGQKYPNGMTGPTIYGGTGCPEDVNGNGTSDRNETPPASELQTGPGEAKVIVFTRAECPFSRKVETGQLKGYDAVLIGNSHESSRNGLLPDAYVCGSQGHDFTPSVPGLCIGHRTMHDLFEDPTNYTGPPADIPIGAKGAKVSAATVFDGLGAVRQLDSSSLLEIGTYAVDEARNEQFVPNFGNLVAHETETDPTENLAYVAYWDAGVRVARFGDGGLEETGAFVDDGNAFRGAPASGPGNDIWGVFPITAADQERYVLASDRSYGLYVLKYTGPGAPQRPQCADAGTQTQVGRPVAVALACTDANGNPLTRSIVAGPANGRLGGIAGDAVTYTPNQGFTGTDTFTFRAFDGAAYSGPATITVSVRAAPPAPLRPGRCANPLAGTTAGDDLLNGTPFGDAIRGGAGKDVLAGLQGEDCLFGEAGADRLSGGAHGDRLDGGGGDDRMFGESGKDELRGGAGRDHMRGSSGNDRLHGSAGNDHLSGGSNDDRLSGGSGRDSIRGDSGNDRVYGGGGNDSIEAGKGRNRISGGKGRDRISAVNAARDAITCGPGRDIVRADARDRVARSCEVVKRTRTTRRAKRRAGR